MRIFICVKPLFNYQDALVDAFKKLGHDVHLYVHRNSCITRLKTKNPFDKIYQIFKFKKINKKILEEVEAFQPDLFLCYGEFLLPKTIETISTKCKTCFWVLDGIDSLKLPLEVMNLYDVQVTFEPQDIPRLKNGRYAYFCCDPKIYFPQTIENKYDLSFVGAAHVNRLPVLNELINFAEQYNFSFGIFGPFPEDDIKGFEKIKKYVVKNAYLSPAEIATVYNQSKINLNIHHTHSVLGVNPRVFEISGCNAFQLCDYKEKLAEFFPDSAIATYKNIDELKQQILYFLEHNQIREEYAQRAFDETLKNHTFENVCEKIIKLTNS